jgi:hypothetical protein
MTERVDVSGTFEHIIVDAMRYVEHAHGADVAHRLFFELYDHTFAFLDRELGFDAVKAFWEQVADHELGPLEELMRTRGFEGMEQYWSAVAAQEGGVFELHRTDDSFDVVVRQCPPCEWFARRGLPHYPRYSEHCSVLYARVAERCGFAMRYTPRDETTGTCCGLHFTRKAEATT